MNMCVYGEHVCVWWTCVWWTCVCMVNMCVYGEHVCVWWTCVCMVNMCVWWTCVCMVNMCVYGEYVCVWWTCVCMVAINKTQPLCIEQQCKCCSPQNWVLHSIWYSLPVGYTPREKKGCVECQILKIACKGKDFIWHISLAAYLADRASRVSSGPVGRTAIKWFCGWTEGSISWDRG